MTYPNCFKPNIEYQSIETIKAFQEQEMRKMLKYLQQNSRFYQRMFAEHHININTIQTLEDLQILPVTTKEDLQRYNKDFICVPQEKIADYVTTSGTLSDPTTFTCTENDLDRLAYNEAISFTCAGGHAGEIYQLMTTIDKRFMAGLAYFLGIKKMGAGIIRVGNGIPELQWDTINRIKPNAIICVPSFILKIINYAKEHHIDYQNCSVKKAICIGENLRDENFELNLLGKKIKENWDIELYSTYASTEMGASFCECQAGKGGHHHPELLICELLDEDNKPVPKGHSGELVITSLRVEGMPLLRFKTGDIVQFHEEPCSCGRTTMRVSPVFGRKKQMIKFKGTTLYPAAFFDVLDNVDFVENYYVEVFTNDIGTDQIKVVVGNKDLKRKEEDIIKDLKDRFRAKLRVAPDISFEDSNHIKEKIQPEIKRKPIKFFDFRNNE